jgi:hypothetical protein
METNHDQSLVFCGGNDGQLTMITVLDKEPSKANIVHTHFSESNDDFAVVSAFTYNRIEGYINKLRTEIESKKDTAKRLLAQTVIDNAN